MRSFEQRFGAIPPEESKLAKENIPLQKLESVYNSASLETKPEKIIATIQKALEYNDLTVEDLKNLPKLQELYNKNLPN